MYLYYVSVFNKLFAVEEYYKRKIIFTGYLGSLLIIHLYN